MVNIRVFSATTILALGLCGLAAGCTDGDPLAGQPLSPTSSGDVGSISIRVSAGDESIPEDGFTIIVDGSEIRRLPASGTLLIADLPVGDHTIELTSVTTGCPVTVSSQIVTVTEGSMTEVVFDIVCAGVIVDGPLPQ